MEKKELKFLIVFFYYNRPDMVRNALHSINKLTYKNFEIAFIDDGSETPGEPIVRSILKPSFLKKVKFINTNDTVEAKIAREGSEIGKYANEAIKESDADIVFMLCDDDAIVPDYLNSLNRFYNYNPNIHYAYCKLKYYDPTLTSYTRAKPNEEDVTNKLINPVTNLDSSQVSWRRQSMIDKDFWFPYPRTRNLDAVMFVHLWHHYKHCSPLKEYGQYKAIFDDQLGNRPFGFHQLDKWTDMSKYAGVEKTPLDNDPKDEYKVNVK
tara:strand:+ start:1622 stop:2419 length:798 start_codon:yes stop_codon:yes gene_type:complete